MDVYFTISNVMKTGSLFRIRFDCEEKLCVINLFRRCAYTHLHAWPRVFVVMLCSSEAVKNLWEAMSVVCTACICTEAVFFHVFLKFKKGLSHDYATACIYASNLECCNPCAGYEIMLCCSGVVVVTELISR